MDENNINFIISLSGSVIIWVLFMLRFRYESFEDNGDKKVNLTTVIDSDKKDEQIKNHNEGIYKDLDFFYKISLAIFGGIAFILLQVNKDGSLPILEVLILWGFWLQFFTAVSLSLMVVAHKRSIILRWQKRFRWWEIFLWGDTWGYIAGFGLTLYALLIARPYLLQYVNPCK